MTAADFDWRVRCYCWLLDASETSGFRTLKRNADVGGVAHSAHLLGLARDVVYDFAHELETRKNWARRLELKLVVEDDHDHLEPADWVAG